jgi:Uma2 family endonuclease
MSTLATKPQAIDYPDSDGQPVADNTLQFEWIVTLQGNLDLLFRDNPDVFVAGDHLIYPVEGSAELRQAPDVYVAFGRPKGHRGSYKMWEEGDIFPQVVFEVWSPNNRQQKMEDKREFYEKYGAEEYYIVYPDFPAHIDGWRHENGKLARIPDVNGYVSPRLGIRFELRRGQVAVYHSDGSRFLSYVERGVQAEEARRKAEEATRQAESARDRAARLAARLRELGVDPDAV